MEVFAARDSAPAARLKLRPFEFDVQRVHESVHQPTERCDRRQFDDLGAVEVLGELRVVVVVVARLVPCDKLGPADDCLLPLAE